MIKQAIIFGIGGHSRVLASLLRGNYVELTFVTKDGTDNSMTESSLYERMDEYRAKADFYIGIGNNEIRRSIYQRLRESDANLPILVAGNAFVADDAEIGSGSFIAPGAIVMTRATIGENSIVNTLSSVDHDCSIGSHSQITAGVTLAGTVTCGPQVFFGIKSAVIPGVRIGGNCQIMAGSLVTKDFGDNLVVGGNPATVIRKNLSM